MACTFKSLTLGNDSVLGQTLYDIAKGDETKANNMLNHFRSPSFMKGFGDYKQALENEYEDNVEMLERVDENGEPKLFYNETDKKHYYINQKQEKVIFPPAAQGLRSFLNSTEIADLSSTIALQFYKETKKLDFETDQDAELDLVPFTMQFIATKMDEIHTNPKATERDLERATTMGEVLENVYELTDNVAKFFKSINFELEDDFTNEDLEVRDYNFSKTSAETNRALGVRQSIKLMISLLEDKRNKDFLFQENKFLPFETVYGTLAHLLVDEVAVTKYNKDGVLENEDILDIFMTKIKHLAKDKTEYNELVEAINNLPEKEKNALVKTFYMGANDVIVTSVETDKKGDKAFVSKPLKRDGSVGKILQDDWFNQFKDNFLKEGLTKKSIVQLDNIVQILSQIEKSEQAIESRTEFTREQLNRLGIIISKNGLNDYLKEGDFYASNETMESRLLSLIEGIHYTLDSNGENVNVKSLSKKLAEDFDFNQARFFRELADSEGKFKEDRADSTTKVGSKTMWNFSNLSYVRAKILAFKKYPQILKEHVRDSKVFYQASQYAQHLLNLNEAGAENSAKSADRMKNFGLNTFLGIQTEDKVIETGELSLNDYLTDNYNKILSDKGVKTIAPADKGTDYQLQIDYSLNTDAERFGEGYRLSQDTVKIFRTYLNAEMMRMEEARKEVLSALQAGDLNKLVIHYHVKAGKFEDLLSRFKADGTIDRKLLGNAFKSQIFPELSFGEDKAQDLNLYDEKGTPNTLYNKDGNLINEQWMNPTLDHGFKDVNDYIRAELDKLINDQYKSLLYNKIFDFDIEGNIINKLIDKDTYKKYFDRMSERLGIEDQQVLHKEVARAIAGDLLVKGIIHNYEYAKIFTGDPAFYKNMVDFKKRVPATYTDGLQLRLKPGRTHFRAAIISSVEIASPYLEAIKDLYDTEVGKKGAEKTYGASRINAADAQSWITPKRWRELIDGVGNWSDTHESAYQKMIGESTEPYTKAELKAAASPVKGVYFELNEGVPTYLKYSQAVLSPGLIKGNKGLENLYSKMVKDDIDEVITLDGIKAGAKNPTTIHNEDGTIKDDFELNPIDLLNSGWKMQQDLPIKTFKETEVGSQIQKNIFAGLIPYLDKPEVTFDYDGRELSAREMINEIVNITKTLSDKGTEKLFRQFKIKEDGTIENIAGFYQSLIDELTKRGGNENVVQALQKEVALYGIPQSQSKIINSFASICLNNIVKIRTNGGSFIQMSNFGLSKSEAEGQGILMSPKLKVGDTTYEPQKTLVDGKIKIKPAGVFISGSFIAKYVPDYKSKTSEELFGKYDEDGNLIEAGLIDSKILDSVIGYRIPNQGLSSNDAMEIVGILPEGNGDTIVAYTGITAKTGSDFDIDKMYVMFPQYTLNEGRLEYDSEDDSNKLIQTYKSVLLNPEVIQTVMKPIDVDFVKDEINSIKQEDTGSALYDFVPDNDIQLRYSFLKGKMGVGQVANVMVDLNRPGQLYINDYNIRGGYHENGRVVLDKQVSNFIAPTEKESREILHEYARLLGKKGQKADDLVEELMQVPLQDSVMAVLNGFVDIAKDPFITKGNWVTATTNTGAMMLRAGVHPLFVVNFLAQPILTEYLELQSSKEGALGEDKEDTKKLFMEKKFAQFVGDNSETFNNTGKEGKDVTVLQSELYKAVVRRGGTDFETINEQLSSSYAKNAVMRLFGVKNKNLTEAQIEKADEIIDNLQKQLSSFFKPSGFTMDNVTFLQLREQHDPNKRSAGFQLEVLDKFFELQQVSKNLKDVTSLMKVDTSGFGKNINGIFALKNLYDKLQAQEKAATPGTISGVTERMTNSITGTYYDNVVTKIAKVVENNPILFPQATKAAQNIFETISQAIYGNSLQNERLNDKLEQGFFNYTMAEFMKQHTKLAEKSNNDYLLGKFMDDIPKAQRAHKGKYLILDQLRVVEDKKTRVKKLVLNNREKSKTFQDDLVNSWRDLSKDIPKLSDFLVEYSFLTTSFNYKSNQFFTLIPHEYFVDKDINSFIKKFTNPSTTQAVQFEDFIDKFLLNNVDDNYLVPRVFDSHFAKIKEVGATKGNLVFINKEDKIKPFIKSGTTGAIYKYHTDLTTEDAGKVAAYIKVNPLQIKNGKDIYTNYLALDKLEAEGVDEALKLIQPFKNTFEKRDIYKISDTANIQAVQTQVTPETTETTKEAEIKETPYEQTDKYTSVLNINKLKSILVENEILTQEQVDNMSLSELEDEFDKICK